MAPQVQSKHGTFEVIQRKQLEHFLKGSPGIAIAMDQDNGLLNVVNAKQKGLSNRFLFEDVM